METTKPATDRQVRNDNARKNVNKLYVMNGISYAFMARYLGVEPSNFRTWQSKKYDYKIDKLKMIEEFINKHNLIDL